MRPIWTLAFIWYPVSVSICQKITLTAFRTLRRAQPDNVKVSQVAYSVVGTVATIFHIHSLGAVWTHPGVFEGFFSLDLSRNASLKQQVLTFFKLDYLLTFLAVLTWAFGECTLRRKARPFQLLLAFVFGTSVFGPGAVLSAVWFRRERELNSMSPEKRVI